MTRILVIKLGALGDFVLALAAMRRIREVHGGAEITLLTTPPFAALGRLCPYVDVVEDDGRVEGTFSIATMLNRLQRRRFDRVYDLQTSSRTELYSAMFAMRRRSPPWSGVGLGATLPHRNPDRDRMHTLERQADQLKDAGVWPDAPTAPGTAPPPDLSWAVAAAAPLDLPAGRLALLIPGGSAHRPEKRWPIERFAALARELAERGLAPVVLGGDGEGALAGAILAAEPAARDLTGRTDLLQLAALGARAALAVGNDTGPTHLVASAGAPTLALFSAASDPALTAPRGPRVCVLQRATLVDLPVDAASAAAFALLGET